MKANTEGIDKVGVLDVLQQQKNPATEETLQEVADNTQPLSGAGASGTRALAIADTWYPVPSTVPGSKYILIVSQENAAGTLRWSFSNTSAPSVTFGNKFTSSDLILELGANEVVYVSSTNAGDDVNWTTKII